MSNYIGVDVCCEVTDIFAPPQYQKCISKALYMVEIPGCSEKPMCMAHATQALFLNAKSRKISMGDVMSGKVKKNG